ncbi:hypothetical protein WDH52_17580 [Streptomyces sp. TRM70308]|uniref:hypothetical protein n=1 Tax=Streptomyces sp. TRM70308 TaxID=3131932 RepID=UPI003D031C71
MYDSLFFLGLETDLSILVTSVRNAASGMGCRNGLRLPEPGGITPVRDASPATGTPAPERGE